MMPNVRAGWLVVERTAASYVTQRMEAARCVADFGGSFHTGDTSMRFVPSVLFVTGVALVPLTGCTRATMLWRPSYVSQVPDGTPARYRVDSHAPIVRGLAVNWMSGDPRLLTPRGDTLTIPPGARLDVQLRQKSGHGVAGAVVGFLAGVAVSYAYCPPPKDYCGEEDPTPLLGASLGAVVGSLFKSYPWVQVRRDGPPAAPR